MDGIANTLQVFMIRRLDLLGLIVVLPGFKKLSGKTLNAFCKRYFQHSNANNIFGSGSKYFEVFR